MKFISRMLLSVLAFSALTTAQNAIPAPDGPRPEIRRMAIEVMRALNTAQARYAFVNHHFATAEDLLDPAFFPLEFQKGRWALLAKSLAEKQGVSGVLPGFELHVIADKERYLMSVIDNKDLGYGVFTTEAGVIYEGRALRSLDGL